MSRNLIVEIYYPGGKKYLLSRSSSTDQMREYLLEFFSPSKSDEICASLKKQKEDPNKFPNVLIFLESSPSPEFVSIESFYNE